MEPSNWFLGINSASQRSLAGWPVPQIGSRHTGLPGWDSIPGPLIIRSTNTVRAQSLEVLSLNMRFTVYFNPNYYPWISRSWIHENTIFVVVSGHNLESSQTWGFRIQCLHYNPVANHFWSGEENPLVRWLWIERRKALKTFVPITSKNSASA